jgi:DNA modification methylase
VTDLLRDWQPKLMPGGVLLLWQASGPLCRAIADAIGEYNWAVERVVIWDKGRAQAGDFAAPYSTQSEWLWVLKRPGDRLVNHDNSPRGDILRFPPVSLPSLAGAQEHAFEKPLELCRFLVNKHSHERELIFDCCGCTGSMSVAAIEMNRQWVYAESNLRNYEGGTARIARSVGQLQAAAS